ncbi:hypothetical protein J2W28_001008 [Variovorax boronicumulans]|uniref:hypothetical protein n=1 Tax=Variovorax boronicumulans TaxID=436515 RepID=UPI00278A2556|nr:hypothetical protein [Variovorax boronicumulans]MDP9991980.1 hypothetical protein [Variovorax boronicumulans]MDQ0001875.1 hypothetical protein [Variovorax boronicumulans]
MIPEISTRTQVLAQKRKMARPPFKPTVVQRRQVAIGAAGGMAHEEIAQALGIARNTLEKHFAIELSTGAHKRRLDWLVAMDKAARGGNVAAQKALLSTSPTPLAPPMPEAPTAAEKAPKLGKKEQANADAVGAQAGTEWNDLLPRGGAPLLQ